MAVFLIRDVCLQEQMRTLGSRALKIQYVDGVPLSAIQRVAFRDLLMLILQCTENVGFIINTENTEALRQRTDHDQPRQH